MRNEECKITKRRKALLLVWAWGMRHDTNKCSVKCAKMQFFQRVETENTEKK